MTDGPRVLVVDDDQPIVSLLGEYLRRAGYSVDAAADGRAALRSLHEGRPDLVILDVGLPELDGWQVLGRIREVSNVPVLMLTARDSELDKVRGLKGGADDYVTKPFGRQELLARVGALLRRAGGPAEREDVYEDGLLRVDFTQNFATVDGEEVQLTPHEFALLAAFVRHPNQLLTHAQILQLAWARDEWEEQGEVKVYVAHLRRKLAACTDARLIETVRGFGYRYRPAA